MERIMSIGITDNRVIAREQHNQNNLIHGSICSPTVGLLRLRLAMTLLNRFILTTFVLLNVLFLACGFGGGQKPTDEKDENLNLPLQDGTVWTYICTHEDSADSFVLVKVIDGLRQFPHDDSTTMNVWYPEEELWLFQAVGDSSILDDSTAVKDSSFYLDDGDYIWMGETEGLLTWLGMDPFFCFRVLKIDSDIGDSIYTLIERSSAYAKVNVSFTSIFTEREDVFTFAGDFNDCVRIEGELIKTAVTNSNPPDTLMGTTVNFILWFADGIGLVKREEFNIISDSITVDSIMTYSEELTDYDI